MTTAAHDSETTSAPARRPWWRRLVWSNAAFLILTPLAAAIAVPWYVAAHGVTWMEIAACLGLWLLTGLAVTAGYHRLFAHRSYQAAAPVRWFFALLGSATWENSVIAWAAAHRYHHNFVDTDDDPYNAQAGFWYSHMGWVMLEGPKHEDYDSVPDLWKDPFLRWQHRHYLAISTAVNVGITVILGLLSGRMLGMFVFALLLRVVLTHHFTFLINSAAHMWGNQPWSRAHSAKDNWLLSFLTFGEGYHNYHHTFQADYRNGTAWYNWDPTKWLIWTLSKLGLAERLQRSPIDARMGQRFDNARELVRSRLEETAGRLDGLRERARTATDDSIADLHERLAEAERRCENTIEELRELRRRWQRALRDGGRRLPEAREIRRQLRTARREAARDLREWREEARRALAAAELRPRAV